MENASTHTRRIQWSHASETATGSTVSAQGDLALIAGQDLTLQGSRANASGDAVLSAGRDIVLASIDNSASTSYSKHGSESMTNYSDSRRTAVGSVAAAGGNLTVTSGGDTVLQGSALDAGKRLALAVGGNLSLLAASSERETHLQKSDARRNLSFELQETRQILSTITAGESMDLKVGEMAP